MFVHVHCCADYHETQQQYSKMLNFKCVSSTRRELYTKYKATDPSSFGHVDHL